MKLIVTRYWEIDYNASGTTPIPFEYSSLEQAYVDFCELRDKTKAKYEEHENWQKALRPLIYDDREEYIRLMKSRDYRDYPSQFTFAGEHWSCDDSSSDDWVKFYTLEDWFEQHKPQV